MDSMRDLNGTTVRLGLEFAELGDGDRSEEPSVMRHYVEDGRRAGKRGADIPRAHGRWKGQETVEQRQRVDRKSHKRRAGSFESRQFASRAARRAV